MEEYADLEFLDVSLWLNLQANGEPFLDPRAEHIAELPLFTHEADNDDHRAATTNSGPPELFSIPPPQPSNFYFPDSDNPVLDVSTADYKNHLQGFIGSLSSYPDQDTGYYPLYSGDATQVTSPWGFSASGSSTFSEAFSPSSEQTLPVSPISPISVIPSQIPFHLESHPMNAPCDFNIGLTFRLPPQSWETQRLLVPPEPQPRRRTRNCPVGRPRTPEYVHAFKLEFVVLSHNPD